MPKGNVGPMLSVFAETTHLRRRLVKHTQGGVALCAKHRARLAAGVTVIEHEPALTAITSARCTTSILTCHQIRDNGRLIRPPILVASGFSTNCPVRITPASDVRGRESTRVAARVRTRYSVADLYGDRPVTVVTETRLRRIDENAIGVFAFIRTPRSILYRHSARFARTRGDGRQHARPAHTRDSSRVSRSLAYRALRAHPSHRSLSSQNGMSS